MKKHTLLRVLCLCLTLSLLLPLLAACGANPAPPENGEENGDPPTGSGEPENKEETPGAEEKNDGEPEEKEEEKPPVVPDPYPTLEGKTPAANGERSYVVKDLKYGERANLSSMHTRSYSQIFDVYLPALPEEIPADTPVFLYIHGGAWSDTQFTKDSDSVWLCRQLADDGMIVFSMNYILVGTQQTGDTVAQMMDDITAMLTHAKTMLAEFGVTATSCAIGGTSAGGHLSSLYAYRYGATAPLTVAYEVDIVGPSDMLTYKPVVESMISSAGSFEAAMQYTASINFPFRTIFGGMVGMKNLTETMLPEFWEAMEEISPVNYVTESSCPSILLYGSTTSTKNNVIPLEFPSDGLVPFACYEELSALLDENGVTHVDKTMPGHGHGEFPSIAKDWLLQQIRDYTATYLKNAD